jgi:ABC-2 type transport system permease protein
MNTPSHVVQESPAAPQGMVSAAASAFRPMYWSIRRELWENRLVYIAPLAAAAVFLVGFVVNLISLRRRMHGVWPVDPMNSLRPGMHGVLPVDPSHQHNALAMPFELSAALVMGIALIVGIFYSLDTLYGERRDRSILFWKSLPVSDLTTVLAKLTIPLVIIPVLSFAIAIGTQFIMLLLGSVVLAGSGANISLLWTQESFFSVSLELFNHMLTVHGLWYAPLYGWLLLVSAAAPRAPLIWAAAPPFVICAVEKLAFNTTYFLDMLKYRLAGPDTPAAAGSSMMDQMSASTAAQFVSEPGLWIGLAIAAVFLAIAVRIRRYRGPI